MTSSKRRRREPDPKILRIMAIERTVTRLGQAGFKWGVLALIGWKAGSAVEAVAQAWAGLQTKAELSLNASGVFTVEGLCENADAWCGYAGLLGLLGFAVGITYGHRQRQLRRQVIERYRRCIEESERSVDPGRSSSGLAETGDTHPRDL